MCVSDQSNVSSQFIWSQLKRNRGSNQETMHMSIDHDQGKDSGNTLRIVRIGGLGWWTCSGSLGHSFTGSFTGPFTGQDFYEGNDIMEWH